MVVKKINPGLPFHTSVLMLLLSCISACNARKPDIQYPEGGYSYLGDITESDNDYYFLPVRKLIPLEDSIGFDSEKYFFKSFGEVNLSIAPLKEDIFRLSVEGYGITPTVITITTSSLTVKQPKKNNSGSLYSIENKDQLTETERQHYFFLQRFFPYKKRTYTHGRQLYIDSMIKNFPRLSDVTYYRYLMNKAVDTNVETFQYDSAIIPLATKQFKWLAESINASGYWTLPYRPALLTAATTDGWGFCLEANTSKKYNIVACDGIGKTAGTEKLKQVCQQILDLAKIESDFKIWTP